MEKKEKKETNDAKKCSRKNEILFFVIGLLLGVIISAGTFTAFTLAGNSRHGEIRGAAQGPALQGNPPSNQNNQNGTPPNLPDGQNGPNNQNNSNNSSDSGNSNTSNNQNSGNTQSSS